MSSCKFSRSTSHIPQSPSPSLGSIRAARRIEVTIASRTGSWSYLLSAALTSCDCFSADTLALRINGVHQSVQTVCTKCFVQRTARIINDI